MRLSPRLFACRGCVIAEVGTAFVSVLPSAKGFGRKLDSQVGGEVGKSGKSVGGKFGNALKVGAAAAVGGAVLAAGFLKGAIGEAREAQKVGALTVSTIKATGGAANVTAKHVGTLAGAISRKTGIDDETIQSGQNMLLTFKNIRNETGKGNKIFDQSSKTLVDLSAAMGTEPKNAAIQLGKALNDPVKGVSALSRVGVTFTDQQKKTIGALVKSGNVMGAQKVILKELNSEFGGAAEAQATAGDKAKVAYDNLKETIGTALLPVVDRFATIFTTKVAPAVSRFVGQMQSGKGAGGAFVSILKLIGGTLLGVIGFFNRHRVVAAVLAGALLAVKGAMVAFGIASKISLFWLKLHTAGTVAHTVVSKIAAGAAKAWAAMQWLLNAAMTANPIGLVIAIIVALVAVFIIAYKKSTTFRKIVNAAFTAVKNVVSAVIGWFGKYVPKVFNFVVNAVKGYMNFVKAVISKAFAVVRSVLSAVGRAFTGAVRFVAQFVTGVKNKLGDAIAFVKSIPGKIKNALGNLAGLLINAGKDLISGLINGIKNMAGKLKDFVGDFIRDHIPGPVRDILGIGSPSKLFEQYGKWTVEGFAKGLSNTAPVDAAMGRLSSRIAVGAPGLDVSATSGSRGRSGVARPINVHGIIDPYALSRELVRQEAFAGVT